MRALLPEPAADVDLHLHYAADWLDRGGLRVNFIASADGAAQAGGKSAGLQTAGDNAVFAALRDLADVILVGAGTAVIEGYRPIRLAERRVRVRSQYGLAATLPTAIVSRTLRMEPTADVFTRAPDGARTIVLTCAAAPPAKRAAFAEVAEVVLCGDDVVEPRAVRTALEERGHGRILCEGGPTVFADFAGAGVIDELCLTVSPTLSGPGPTRIVTGAPWPEVRSGELVAVLEEDGALFLRYRLATGR